VREDDGGNGGNGGELKERGERRRHPDETEIGSDICHPEASDWSHNTGDQGDEDLRPAKRRKIPPTPTDNALTPPDEPTAVDNDDHHPSRTSRSPSIAVESAPVAEYQEWPFQGFLKRTKIGDKTIYDLGFQLPDVPEQLQLLILSKALGMRSDKEASAEPTALHDAGVHSKMHPAAARRPIKRVRWTPKEHATILKMREEDGCSWEEIHAALLVSLWGHPGALFCETQKSSIGRSDSAVVLSQWQDDLKYHFIHLLSWAWFLDGFLEVRVTSHT
jgi:hypothetical protein